MTTKYRNRILKLYKKSVEENINDISRTLKESDLYSKEIISLYRDILEMSSNKITHKWEKGEKYLRTEFVLEAFGQHYPSDFLSLSVKIDAMINMLDDLLDENFNKDDKVKYILEYLRIFSLYSLDKSNLKFQVNVGHYFNKLITLALGEQWMLAEARKKDNLEEVVRLSSDLLCLRAYDIDIFTEIALSSYKQDKNMFVIKKMGKAFRAINILKKDIFDVERDKRENQETLITFVDSQDKFDFSTYINNLVKLISDMAESVQQESKSEGSKMTYPLRQFRIMIERDIKEIDQYLTKYC